MESDTAAADTPVPPKLSLMALTVMRMVLAAWVGAAVLFVLTSVAEQVSPEFDPVIRDQLATIRFPFYYAVGTAACTLALASGVLCRSLRRRLTVALLLVALASVVYALDYWFIYRPLQAMIIPPGAPRTEQFDQLHQWSARINAVHLMLMLLASVLTAIPFSATRAPSAQQTHGAEHSGGMDPWSG